MLSTSLLFLGLAGSAVLGHPVKRSPEEIAVLQQAKRSLGACNKVLSKRGLLSKASERRATWAEQIRREQGFENKKVYTKRDLATALNTSHHSDLEGTLGLTQWVNPEMLFGSNSSCALEADPDTTEGPYFVAGEYVRQDLTDNEDGVPIWLDIEVIDIETCTPVSARYIEIWAANATGEYSGVTDGGNQNLNETHGRGLQKTTEDGYVQFKTLFPGHYSGRAPHIHVAVFPNATALLNGTIYSSTASHVGQMFADTSLADEVYAVGAYLENNSTRTSNDEDGILAQQAASIDPFLEYVYLGDDVSEGLLMWTQLAVNMSNIIEMSVAATHYADGGVANSNGMSMGGGGGGGNGTAPGGQGGMGGNGTAPSGMDMSGTPPSASGTGSADTAASVTSIADSAASGAAALDVSPATVTVTVDSCSSAA